MTLNGIPLHPLLVHFEVVLVLAAAAVATVTVLWPAARRRIGLSGPIIGLVATLLTPLTTSAGESLAATKRHLNPVLVTHIQLGDQMIWWILPLFVCMTAFWAIHALPRIHQQLSAKPAAFRAVCIGLGAMTVVLAVGTAIWLYRIGDTGAQSVWLD